MLGTQMSAEAMAHKVKGDDLVQFKLKMDALKDRLAKSEDPDKQLKKVCQDFEAIFIGKIWKGMRDTVPKEGYLHSPMEDQYMSMFDKDFSEKMAQDGGIGLADMLFSQLKQKLANTSRNTLTGGAATEVRELTPKDAFRADMVEADRPIHPELTAGGAARDSLAGSGEDEPAPGMTALDKANALAERIVREHRDRPLAGGVSGRARGYRAVEGDAVPLVGRNLATKG